MTSQVTIVNGITGHVIVETEWDDTTLIRNVMTEVRKAVGGLWECRLLAKERLLSPIDKVSQAVIEGEGKLTAILMDLKTDLKKEGNLWEFDKLMSRGFSVQELIAAGFPKFSPNYLRLMWSVNLQELQAAGYTLENLVVLNARHLVQLGYSLEDLLAYDFSLQQFVDAGFQVDELKAAGFDAQQLIDCGFSSQQLQDAGF